MRLTPSIWKELIFLSDTDTTVGFITQCSKCLDSIKERPANKLYIHALESLAILQNIGRIPPKYRRMVRRKKRCSFILPNGASFRVIRDPRHLLLLRRLGGWAYTSSANLAGASYDESFARKKADIIVESLKRGDASASTILLLGRERIKRVR